MSNWLDEVKWDAQGLVTAIAQDSATGRVLMVAWMNRESLQLTPTPALPITGAVRARSCGKRARSPAICKPCTSCGWIATAT
jgi:hypothetical protein